MNTKSIISRSSLWLVALALGVILLTQTSPANDNSVKTVEQPVVVDAQGRPLGSVVALNGPAATVLINVGGGLFSLNVLPNQLSGNGGLVYFTTSNCSGTPYITQQPPGLSTQAVLGGPGNSLYAPVPNAIPSFITPLSVLFPSNSGAPLACAPPPPPPSPAMVFAVAAMSLVDLNTAFTPPFNIRSN